MAELTFIADRTIPGLSARDLVRRAADAVVAATGGLGTSSSRESAYRQAFNGWDRRLLQDIGVDRGGC
ncbi:MAG: hypothetical protein QNJ30_10250 [Kiloniellales bacterium]|nr:hypothetical protein [Kiloniellales bacterium]